MTPKRLLILPVLAATLALASCGGGKGSDETAATPAPTQAATEAATPEATKPEVTKPAGPAPKTLVIKDLKAGTGAEAQDGKTVTVQYVGVSFKTGRQFDASWDRGQPFSFPLGQGQVIPGWDEGVKGMKVGGRRELVIPPKLAYGAQGSPPAIGKNETLIFVVDLLAVQ
jgi:peptidylprolyl isomerase